jgi:hypothetical protein
MKKTRGQKSRVRVPLTRVFLGQQCHATSLTKIGNFVVDFLREYEVIFKKALTRVSGA